LTFTVKDSTMTDNNTSDGGSATPTPSTPVTGTPAAGGATPSVAALTLEEASKRIADLEHSYKNATEEVERHRKNAKRLADLEKAEAERQAAQLSKEEQYQKQIADLQASQEEAAQALFEQKLDLHAREEAAKLGVKAEYLPYVVRMLEWEDIEVDDETGVPKNVKDIVKKLVEAIPDLAPQATQPGIPRPPTVPAMNPGRTSIQSPANNQPRRVPTWDEVYKRP
jgi:hypothetical protein